MDQKTAAVLFVDVSGSTAFFDKYGEVAGHAMVKRCLEVVVPEVEKRRGRVVKYMGDGFLAMFDSADDAVEAAVGLHTALADANAALPAAASVRLHSGLSSGPVIVAADGDVYGDTVNVAARVQHVAGPDQIYATADVVQVLGPTSRQRLRRVGVFPLRGKEEEVEIHEVMWKLDGATMLFSRSALREETRLTLFHAGRVAELSPGQTRLTLGRVVGNDVVVEDGAVSREHAEVVRRRGAAYLVDRSTNGTYVRPQFGTARHLHREEFLLDGAGEIALGRPDGPVIEYKVT
jgi:adenylate cyclase